MRDRRRRRGPRRIWKLLGVVAAFLLLLQIPFIIRAWQVWSAADKIRSATAGRADPPSGPLNEYVAVLHVHSVHTGELSDAYDEMLAAACDNKLDAVLLTEHYSTAFDTSAASLNGNYGSILFIAGNEVNSRPGDRFLVLPGTSEAADFRLMQSAEIVDKTHTADGISIVAYPEKFAAWDASFDGVEVLNLNTAVRAANPLLLALDYPWSGNIDRALAFARFLRRPDENLRKFDELASRRRLFLTAGLDAHSGVGFHVFGDELGASLFKIKADPYAEIFRIARLHVLSTGALTRESLLAAVKNGQFFVGMDVLGDTRGFRFAASNGAAMGEETALGTSLKVTATAPYPARIIILRNGEKIAEGHGSDLTAEASAAGAYRVEVYREDVGTAFADVPWILSNPIFVR